VNVIAVTAPGQGLKAACRERAPGFQTCTKARRLFLCHIVVVQPPETQDYLSVREPIAKQLYVEHVQAESLTGLKSSEATPRS